MRRLNKGEAVIRSSHHAVCRMIKSQRGLVVVDQLGDRRRGDVEHRLGIDAQRDGDHHQGRQDRDFARTEVLDGLERRPFGELSGGQKQRLLFALAICGNPDLLFLDEPTVGMDVEARRALWDQIRRLLARGKTVLLTTHYLQEADALADRIVVIQQGSMIAEGTPAEIKSRTAGRQIRCATSLPIATLCSIPGILDVRSDRGAFVIHATEAESVVRELMLRDLQLHDLEVTSAGLEEAFLALTRDVDKSNDPEITR